MDQVEQKSKHYVCTGECGGVSDEPGVCQAESCSQHGQPLAECACADPASHQVSAADQPESQETDQPGQLSL